METYTRSQVAALLRVPPRKLEGWVARGVLKAEGQGLGTGNPYRYTLPEVVRAAILLEAHENLGPRFIRPGYLSSLLHEHLSDRDLEQERRRIEAVQADTPAGRGRGRRAPVGEPDDAVLHIYRPWEERPDGSSRRGRGLTVEMMLRKDEHALPAGYVSLRVEVGPIIRGLLWRRARLDEA